MPPKTKQDNCNKPKLDVLSPPSHRGLRFSARQREKQEKMLAIEQECKAAALHAGVLKLFSFVLSIQELSFHTHCLWYSPYCYQRI